MAKVTPKVAPKAIPAAKSKEDTKATKAKEKETQDALIAASATELVASVEAVHEAEKSRLEAYLGLVDKAAEMVEEHSFERSSVVSLLRMAFAEAGDYDADELVPDKDDPGKVQRLHASDSVEISGILQVLFPKDENKKALAKARKAIDAGKESSWGRLLQVARKGGELTTPGKRGLKPGQTKGNGAKDVFATLDEYKNALAGLLQKAAKSGLADEMEELETATIDQFEEFKAAHEEAATAEEDKE